MAATPSEAPQTTKGWILGTLIIVAVLVVGAALWIHYHG